jgi:hypothetical protein
LYQSIVIAIPVPSRERIVKNVLGSVREIDVVFQIILLLKKSIFQIMALMLIVKRTNVNLAKGEFLARKNLNKVIAAGEGRAKRNLQKLLNRRRGTSRRNPIL